MGVFLRRLFALALTSVITLAAGNVYAESYFYDNGRKVGLSSTGQQDASGRPLFFTEPAGQTRDGKAIARDVAHAAALTNQFVVRLAPGADAAALAKQAGASVVHGYSFAPGFVLMKAPTPQAALAAANALVEQGKVQSATPEFARQQQKRDLPNDPLFGNQWHLKNTGNPNQDVNATNWWSFGGNTHLGAGVNIAIVDDGLERTHPDLVSNYVASLSTDINGGDSDPSPDSSSFHGTSCAGVAAGVGNNSLGVTGAAPRAGLAGVRLIAAATTDTQESQGLTFQNNNQGGIGTNWIYTNSWGPNDDGATLEAPGAVTKAALANAVQTGRGGKGSIFTWAAGNGGAGDNSNYDGYANSRYVIAVAASTNTGAQASYSERGSNLFVNTPSNGGSLAITTTDRVGTVGYNTATSASGGDYTNTFGGTSSSSPLAAGCIALMLEANPNLTWRDVKHILVRSSQKNSPADSSWITNSAGRNHSEKFGFGRIDVTAASTMAQTWTNVGPEISTSGSATPITPINIPDGSGTSTAIFGGFATSTIDMVNQIRIEEIEVTVNVTHAFRGDLEFQLLSPTGVVSTLGTDRNDSGDNYSNWTFTTVRDWDELGKGTWTLKVRDGYSGFTGTLNSWSMNIFGTQVVPEPASLSLLGFGVLVFRRRRANR